MDNQEATESTQTNKCKKPYQKTIMEIIQNTPKIKTQLQQKDDMEKTANNLRKSASIEKNNNKSVPTPLSRLLKQKEENNRYKMNQGRKQVSIEQKLSAAVNKCEGN